MILVSLCGDESLSDALWRFCSNMKLSFSVWLALVLGLDYQAVKQLQIGVIAQRPGDQTDDAGIVEEWDTYKAVALNQAKTRAKGKLKLANGAGRLLLFQ
ncbi:hypothetical protein QE152_g11166 [Popillia japonica]|uniref:Uncharacterized protein n=1 Tax=Popillia japonica TaxID=7064 RepID=A0AAW1LSU6_POPJA